MSDGVTGEFCQMFKKELTQSLPNLFQERVQDGILSSPFCDAATLIRKPGKGNTKNTHKTQTSVSSTYMQNCQNTYETNQSCVKGITHHD